MNYNKSVLFENILKKNDQFIHQTQILQHHPEMLKILAKKVNEEHICIVSGITGIGKTDLLRSLIQKAAIGQKSFYFNGKLDTFGHIKTKHDIQKLLELKLQSHPEVKFLFLQNIGHIENIKELLQELFETKYKIIIVGNDVQVGGIPELELKVIPGEDLYKNLYYGNLIGYKNEPVEQYKNNILLKRDSIVLHDIVELKSVKNSKLFCALMNYLAQKQGFSSLREIHRDFNEYGGNIALNTCMDYLDYSEQSKITQKISLYDLKNHKEISSKSQYYFLDNGIRNSMQDFQLSKLTLIKNLIFVKLYSCSFGIFGGKNGTFLCDFVAKKDTSTTLIHFHTSTNKQELKKDMKKMLKVEGVKKAYLLIEKKDIFDIRKTNYEHLEIMELEDFLKTEL